jgi:hypothetical protein
MGGVVQILRDNVCKHPAVRAWSVALDNPDQRAGLRLR